MGLVARLHLCLQIVSLRQVVVLKLKHDALVDTVWEHEGERILALAILDLTIIEVCDSVFDVKNVLGETCHSSGGWGLTELISLAHSLEVGALVTAKTDSDGSGLKRLLKVNLYLTLDWSSNRKGSLLVVKLDKDTAR